MALVDQVHIARRFQRSIRIDSDLAKPGALEGFICPPSSREVLLTMARHVSETGHGAFTWTGPYGSGKSSLAVALSALLNGNIPLQEQASEIFGRDFAGTMRRAFPPGRKGWRVVPVVGRRGNPTAVIGEAVRATRLIQRKPRGGWTEDLLVKSLSTTATASKDSGGVCMLIDEMGKFLEGAAQNSEDIYIFQQLAEAASRSDGRLLVIGILHQAFEEYANRLSREMRDEWAKIQGRFLDLAVNASADEQIELISHAIESGLNRKEPRTLSSETARLAYNERPENAGRLAAVLENCWPLHPIVACLLGPISRRRFGQNQRSIFGFLNSSEPHGFQDFLRRSSEDQLYLPDRLWDYLRANLEPSILASPDGHRWALAAEALERCEAHGGDALHLRVLKTIAVLDLFKERSNLSASLGLLRLCIPGVDGGGLSKVLDDLSAWSLIIFKKYQNSYSIFAGSDFDFGEAVSTALDCILEIDFARLKALAGLQPVLAKRHFHETGALRWFDVNLAPLRDLVRSASRYKPSNGAIGQFLLAIPTDGDDERAAEELCREAARQSGSFDIVVGLSRRSWTVMTLARELLALENVRNDRPELQGDSVARREIRARLADLQTRLEAELRSAFDSAAWYRKYQRQAKRYRHSDLNSLASDLADRRFAKSPRLHNELLNRQKPSSSAIAAQNDLLRRMVLNQGEVRLGIEGFPAEGGLFASILEATGLYAETRDGWRFVPPDHGGRDDPNRLTPIWGAALDLVEAHPDRTVAVSEIYDVWCEQPFGVKDGLMPVLVVAFIQSQRNVLAVYREGFFRAHFGDVDVQYLAKDAKAIRLRWMDLSGVARRLLSEMAEIVRNLDPENSLANLEPIDVARGLVSLYERLPPWTQRTMRLSANALHVRDLFKRASDPNKFLFDDIPATGPDAQPDDIESLRTVVNCIRDGLEELMQAYPAMLGRLRELMLRELQVPNSSPQSLAELRDRAGNIRQLAGDFRLDAFVGRISQYDGTEAAFEGIASLAANKPPRNWVDPDLDRASIELADMAQRFLRAETFARVKGRRDKRHAMAVVIGREEPPRPILEEFEVADGDNSAVNELIARVEAALEQANISRRNLILAALAEVSTRYMRNAQEGRGLEEKERAIS